MPLHTDGIWNQLITGGAVLFGGLKGLETFIFLNIHTTPSYWPNLLSGVFTAFATGGAAYLGGVVVKTVIKVLRPYWRASITFIKRTFKKPKP